jgi:transcriptional regulator of acetoin/glycerol metabolism
LSILITGEIGTGKELTARRVHVISRPSGPFVAFNCASVEELIGSKFFGHEKASFTFRVPSTPQKPCREIGRVFAYLELFFSSPTIKKSKVAAMSP